MQTIMDASGKTGLGVQVIFSSFFLSIPELRRR
jgi:hypothetical protein